MSVKIITNQEPKVDTYHIPAGMRTLTYQDFDWRDSVTIPRVEPEVPRTATRIMLGSGEVIFVIDKKVKAEKHGAIFQVPEKVLDVDKALEIELKRAGIPKEAKIERFPDSLLDVVEFRLTYWEVTW